MGESIKGSEVVGVVDTGRELIGAGQRINTTLTTVIFSVFLLGVLLVLWLLTFSDIIPFDEYIGFLDFLILISLFVLFIVNWRTVNPIIEFRQALDDFYEFFRPFWFKTRFEMLPRGGDDVARDIWSKLTYLYPFLFRGRSTRVRFGDEIQGEVALHRFDIYSTATNSNLPSTIPIVKWNSVFVRILKKSSPVGKADVESFMNDVNDVLLAKERHRPFVLILASHSGFDEDAIEFAGGEAGLPKEDVRSVLLRISPNSYRIDWTN
jgi:hypothetical protein